MLHDFICHRDTILKFAKMEKERYNRIGEIVDWQTKARAEALDGINTKSLGTVIAGLIWNLRNEMHVIEEIDPSIDTDIDINSSLAAIDEIGLSLRYLVEGLACVNGQLTEELIEE